ncbi:MAG TPA: TetR/AcrR family transcriptional regulator [Terriglobales bacterium]|nr:TetR/AcrR family transcriptional regulator [Terriglobales bacterium]
MTAAQAKPQLGSRRQPEESRAAILKAAIHEFSHEGVAGARTDAIARAAKVNKALLYYYFKDKDALYGAVLDHVFSGLRQAIEHELDRDLPPRKKLLAYVGAHYDYVASNPRFPRVVQANMMWAGSRTREQFQRIAKLYLVPIYTRIGRLVQEGIDSGEFRPVDPFHFIATMVATIITYFNQAPMMSLMNGVDALSPENVATHRAAVLDFIAAGLFTQKSARKGARR